MAAPALGDGTFSGGIPYLRFGSGDKTLLFLAGGRGNTVPSGFGASGFVCGMKGFTDEYPMLTSSLKCNGDHPSAPAFPRCLEAQALPRCE